MKKILTITLFIGIFIYSYAEPVHAFSGTTVGGSVACLKKTWIEHMVSFVGNGDKSSFKAYIDSSKCLLMKSGVKVTITDSPGLLGGYAGFIVSGVQLWTVREGLTYGQ